MSLKRDIEVLVERLAERYGDGITPCLVGIGDKLLKLASEGLVKSNHSVMELVVAAFLASKGYEVDVEKELGKGLVCDVYGERDKESIIVEIETGFVPPSNALDPVRYRVAREISKVARYSRHADRFVMATPPYHVVYIPEFLVRKSDKRNESELISAKKLLDEYYRRPPISLEELRRAKVDYVYIVYVDELRVLEYSAKEYAYRFSFYNGFFEL